MGLKFRVSDEHFTEGLNGSRCYYTPLPFRSVAKVERCPCEDGVRRTAFATAEADTFFSVPACVYVGRKTVGGFISHDAQGWRFTAYGCGKNAALIKGAPRGMLVDEIKHGD